MILGAEIGMIVMGIMALSFKWTGAGIEAAVVVFYIIILYAVGLRLAAPSE